MADEKDVQDGTVLLDSDTKSPDSGTESPEAGTETKETETTPQPQPLSEERIQQLISEQVDQASRRFQSEKDKAVSEVRREAEKRTRYAESGRDAYKAGFDGLDEETRKDAELAMYREKDKSYADLTREDEQRRGQDTYFESLKQSLRDEVQALGIDPDNKVVDYALDEADYFKGRKRFSESISKVLKETQSNAEKKMTDTFKAMELKLRQDLGVDESDTTTSAGVGGGDDAKFIEGMSDGSIPLTKKNEERLNKIQKLE